MRILDACNLFFCLSTIVIFAVSVAALTRSDVFLKTNYRGRKVFLAGFWVNSLAVIFGFLLLEAYKFRLLLAISMLISLIGLFDDLFGGSEKGLKGHLRALLKRRITTGSVKLVGIGLMSVFTGYIFSTSLLDALLNAVLLAGTSNLFNLLDLRPGRSIKFALIPVLVSVVFLSREQLQFALLFFIFYLVYLPLDLREKAMLGDAGSNPLGFFVGAILVFIAKITIIKAFLVLIVVLLNLASEKVSFTEVIEKNFILNFYDRIGRI